MGKYFDGWGIVAFDFDFWLVGLSDHSDTFARYS